MKGFEDYYKNPSLEKVYNITSKKLPLKRHMTITGKQVDLFKSPGTVLITTTFPEFTCLCPKTNQPDFGEFKLVYIPKETCVELKSLKYYLNSYRQEGHFHEEVCCIIERDLRLVLKPIKLQILIDFNYRGGLSTLVSAGDTLYE